MATPHDVQSIGPGAAGTTAAESASAKAPTSDQLRLLAAQFEALLMGQMLKQMQSSMWGDDEEADAGFAKGPLADAMYSELSLALSRSGGLGMAESMLAPLLRQSGGVGEGIGGSIADRLSPDALEAAGLPPSVSPGLSPFVPAGVPLASPTSLGQVTSSFGWRQDPFAKALKFHKGTDIAMPAGQEVPSAQSGKVTFAGEQSGYGFTVVVEHEPGLSTRYAHLSAIDVSVGDAVLLGQTIGKSGASGRATGPHLHFEVIDDGRPIDPEEGLARLGTSLQRND
jgi:murein DD-endopeptidase MepM/ murein hydrolase activator NlpD